MVLEGEENLLTVLVSNVEGLTFIIGDRQFLLFFRGEATESSKLDGSKCEGKNRFYRTLLRL